MSNKYRVENCVFCPDNKGRCSILERTACNQTKKEHCSFYKTAEDYKQGQAYASRILNSKGLVVKIENNIVRAIERKV